jgi:hypothetical protein
VHRDKLHPGMHPAIVEAELFEAVQARMAANQRQRAARRDRVPRAPLTGRIFDVDGNPMSPTFSYGRRKKCYRYYVSAPLQQGQRRPAGDETIRRVPAPALEARLTGLLRRLLPSAGSDPLDLLARVEIHAHAVHLLLPAGLPEDLHRHLLDGEAFAQDRRDPALLRLVVPLRMQLHGGRTMIIGAADAPARPDPVLIRGLRARARDARERRRRAYARGDPGLALPSVSGAARFPRPRAAAGDSGRPAAARANSQAAARLAPAAALERAGQGLWRGDVGLIAGRHSEA